MILHFSLQNIYADLDRFQYQFQPIKFMNLVVPSPCETELYNKQRIQSIWCLAILSSGVFAYYRNQMESLKK